MPQKRLRWLAYFMQNSKSKTLKVWLNRISWLTGFASRFVPSKLKAMMVVISTIAGGLVALMDKCDQTAKSPAPIQIETPTPSPTPEPTPEPTPQPTPALKAPERVKAGNVFAVELCNVGMRYNVSLFADDYRLGYMGFHSPCMLLNVSLNGKGKRYLHVKDLGDLSLGIHVIVE